MRIKNSATTGDKVGRLRIKEVYQKDFGTYKKKVAICQCDCGRETSPNLSDIRSGKTVSCGCYNNDIKAEREFKHGYADTKLYSVYRGMMARCYQVDHKSYHNYGGRGIEVCERWFESVINFVEDVSDLYVDGYDMDRINNDGCYCLENIRWVPRKVNLRNKRKQPKVTSKYKFVSYDSFRNKWKSYMLDSDGKQMNFGRFNSEVEAAKVSYSKFKEYYGFWPPYCEDHLSELGLSEG